MSVLDDFEQRASFKPGLQLELLQLFAAGKFELAQHIKREFAPDLEMAADIAGHLHDGPDRRIIYDELSQSFASSAGKYFLPSTWMSYLFLLEYFGRTIELREALAGALRCLAELEADIETLTDEQVRGAFELSCMMFDIRRMELFLAQSPGASDFALWLDVIAAYRAAMTGELDAEQPFHTLQLFASGGTIALDAPTIIIRVGTGFWSKLMRGKTRDLRKRFLPICLAEPILQKGLKCLFVPQFSNPGPNFSAPFRRDDPNLVMVLGHHKYCPSPDKKLLNYRSYLKERFLFDRGGYSGWLEMPNIETLGEKGASADAKAYCDKKRLETFNGLPWPENVPSKKFYVFIPLQLQNDSVMELAYMTTRDMIENCRRYFGSRGWHIVLKRHPKDVNPAMSSLLDEYKSCPNVVVDHAPSEQLVMHSQAVALVNSSVGWEAVLAHKPILAFGNSEYASIACQIKSQADLEAINIHVDEARRLQYDALFYYFMTQRTVSTDIEICKGEFERYLGSIWPGGGTKG